MSAFLSAKGVIHGGIQYVRVEFSTFPSYRHYIPYTFRAHASLSSTQGLLS
jgi:hypothetical protein